MPAFTFLSDATSADATVELDFAEQSFDHGHLEVAQQAAQHGYSQFFYSQPLMAKKFQILLASSMLWRGLYEDALSSLDDNRILWADRNDIIERSSLQATALTLLNRLDEAEQTLVAVSRLCNSQSSRQCGSALRAQGLFFLERGQTELAEQMFSKSLSFARAAGDSVLETTALQNLGYVASLQEHHDSALEFYRLSAAKARDIGAMDLQQRALGNEGWEQYQIGNPEKALEMFGRAESSSAVLGDVGYEARWLLTSALAYSDMGELVSAEQSDLHALQLARKINKKQAIVGASMDLAQLYIRLNKPNEAEQYLGQARAMGGEVGSPIDLLTCSLLAGEAASLLRDYPRAHQFLEEVSDSPDSQPSMKWQAERALGRMYEAQADLMPAQRSYEAALGFVEAARADLNQEVSRLTFLENASSIYDDYIHLLVSEGKTQEALEAADWSRARTLRQGLGSIAAPASTPGSKAGAKLRTVSTQSAAAPRLKASEIARRTNSSLLFYWLGEKQSYLWVISPEETRFLTLPPRSAILPVMERYRRAILGLKDPLRAGAGEVAEDGASLYETLVAPAAKQLKPGRPVALFVDGELGQLNFETLLVPSPSLHFWIEDATVLQAPSIRMFAEADRSTRKAGSAADSMLLFGDTAPSGTEFRPLPLAALEMQTVKGYFAATTKELQGAKATPAAYLNGDPERFDYIHFVAHGTASRTDPLDSAVILSRQGTGEDSYKLYARDIVRHPIHARLVTVSACNSSGSKSFAGEGLVGLSWAFLRAGAHNAIGSLWEVSDASTAELMNTLYGELHRGQPPASALRAAKLALLHSGGRFERPFYWAPFQLYAGR